MFFVLGLRPGEMFAPRWNDKGGNSLRIDSSITQGIEVETKTEGSDVWLPALLETELEWWRQAASDAKPEFFMFPSARGTAIQTNNFLNRVRMMRRGKKPGWKASTTRYSAAPA
jgi:integrase